MDPATAAAMASVMQRLIGGKQIGAPAPAPMLGGTHGVGGNADAIAQLAMQNNFGQGGMIGGLPGAMQNLPEGGSEVPPKETQEPSGLGKFFGNLDSTLSSPSKTLGIGALGQIDPRLALAGLLASGFWNQQ